MNLKFNEVGYLEPIGLIECDLVSLEKYFVDDFPNSITRKRLFVNYLRYLESFKSRVSRHFTQWINGSFVSQKENPKDIDLVTFVDFEIYEAQEPYLEKFWSFSLENEGLDAYLVAVYPSYHTKNDEYLEKCKKWQRIYTNAKRETEIIPNSKGFLQIKFE